MSYKEGSDSTFMHLDKTRKVDDLIKAAQKSKGSLKSLGSSINK